MGYKFYIKLRDRSLNAFKEWFQGYRLPGFSSAKDLKTKHWMDEGQWIAYWKLFWARMDGSSSNRQNPLKR